MNPPSLSPAAMALQWLLDTPAALAVMTPSGMVEAATPAFAGALGTRADALSGAALGPWLAPDERDPVAARIAGAAAHDTTLGAATDFPPAVASGRGPDGTPFRCRFTFSSVPGAGAAVVTAERLSPLFVPAGREHAEPVTSFTNDVAAALSHDIRASLRSVNGFLGLVERSPAIQADDTARKHLRTSREAGATADHGVEALVRLMRIRERPLAVRTVLLAAVIDKGIQHSLEVLPGTVPVIEHPPGALTVLGDPLLVGECIGELFTNSRKFGGDMVKISVTCTEQEGWLYLRIADDGPGVSPDLAVDAFRLFRLLQPKGKFPGVGMGLPLARVIAESHCGTLAFEPHAGPGAVAVLRLPAGSGDA